MKRGDHKINFGPKCNPCFAAGDAIKSPTAPAPLETTARLSSLNKRLPAWQCERKLRLLKICQAIEKSRKKGWKLRRCLRGPARTARKQKFYHCDPQRPLRLSRKTIERAYYHWRAHGRTPGSFVLRYNTPRVLSNAIASEFLALCVAPGVTHKKEAARRMRNFRGCYHSLNRTLAPEINRAVMHIHRARRAVTRAEKRFEKIVKGRLT